MVIKILKILGFLILILTISSCISYSPLPSDYKTSNVLEGRFCNDACLNPFGDYIKLWDFIQPRTSVDKDSLIVNLRFVGKNKLYAELLDGDSVIAKKNKKIKLKEDGCYYSRRVFYIIPIFPILWGYSNSQERFIVGDNSIIVERTSSDGGVSLIMAGGNDNNDSWEFSKKE